MEGPPEPDLLTTVSMTPSETPVRAVMSPGVIAVSAETTAAACAAAMQERRTHAVLVIDDKSRHPLGWVFHRDLLRCLRQDPYTTRAGDFISAEASYIDPEETIEDAAERMVEEGVTHLLVGHSPDALPEGVLSSWDVVSYYAGRAGRAR
jgi:CBS domain-containing protein